MGPDVGERNQLLTLTVGIVSSHVANNPVAASDLPAVIENVFSTLSKLGVSDVELVPKQEPAVSIRASVKPDYIVCLEDGKRLKLLKRYLRTHYNMTPEAYRAKWNLPAAYPMVAPNYARMRRAHALNIGLGRKPAEPDQSLEQDRMRKKVTSDSGSEGAPTGPKRRARGSRKPISSEA